MKDSKYFSVKNATFRQSLLESKSGSGSPPVRNARPGCLYKELDSAMLFLLTGYEVYQREGA
jgi:hypothetical protein